MHTHTRARTQSHNHTYTSILHSKPQWLGHGKADVLMVFTNGTWQSGDVASCPKICKPPHTSSPSPWPKCRLRLSRRDHRAAKVSTDGRGTKGQERGHRSWSCRAWAPSGLQTAEVRLPQDSVDVVIGDTAAISMETVLQGAGRVFRLWAEGVLGDAVVLTVYARPGAGHYCSLWAADPVTAVAAGRLQTEPEMGFDFQPRGRMQKQWIKILSFFWHFSWVYAIQGHAYQLIYPLMSVDVQ